MTFSATLTLNDLNDYLAPSQVCIKPIEVEEEVEQVDGAKTAIHIDSSTGSYYEMALPSTLPSTLAKRPGDVASFAGAGPEEKKKLKKAEISLNDCLACSGCITTSQELLLQTHSLGPLLDLLPPNAPTKTPFLTISPQSLSSISASLPTPVALPILLHRLRTFLPTIGIPHVADLTFARHISLSETVREFGERKRGEGGGLPMLASACPGWVCYAEKAHGEVLEKVGKGRSAMGVMGALVKGWWARRNGVDPESIYHVSIQPCYDRKLESSRTQFISSLTSQPETDLVLTTGEFDSFVREHGFDSLVAVPGEAELVNLLQSADQGWECEGFPSMLDHPGSSSDSYLHSLLFHMIGSYPPNTLTLATTPIRASPDYIEYALSVADSATPADATTTSSSSSTTYLPLPASGTVLLKAAKCYGFKNLQNVVRKTKSATAAPSALATRRPQPKGYDYVEVMACPSGCVNGGGQLKPPAPSTNGTSSDPIVAAPREKLDEEGFPRPWEAMDTSAAQVVDVEMRWSTKEWVARVEAIYWGREPPVAGAEVAAPLKAEKGVARVQEGRGQGGLRLAEERELDVRVEMGGWEKSIGAGTGDGWVRTSYEEVKPEDDGMLLGSGVVW